LFQFRTFKRGKEPEQLKEQEQDIEQSPLSLDQKVEIEIDEALPVVDEPQIENTQVNGLSDFKTDVENEKSIEISDKKLSVSELTTVGEVKNYIGKFLAEEVEKEILIAVMMLLMHLIKRVLMF
jgi:hypothetical protein